MWCLGQVCEETASTILRMSIVFGRHSLLLLFPSLLQECPLYWRHNTFCLEHNCSTQNYAELKTVKLFLMTSGCFVFFLFLCWCLFPLFAVVELCSENTFFVLCNFCAHTVTRLHGGNGFTTQLVWVWILFSFLLCTRVFVLHSFGLNGCKDVCMLKSTGMVEFTRMHVFGQKICGFACFAMKTFEMENLLTPAFSFNFQLKDLSSEGRVSMLCDYGTLQ